MKHKGKGKAELLSYLFAKQLEKDGYTQYYIPKTKERTESD